MIKSKGRFCLPFDLILVYGEEYCVIDTLQFFNLCSHAVHQLLAKKLFHLGP